MLPGVDSIEGAAGQAVLNGSIRGAQWETSIDFCLILAVARSGNLTKVARELNATQPTVSLQLRSLRKPLGMPLFERPGGRVRRVPAF